MKLELFLKLKIQAGIGLLEVELPRLDAEDFEFVREQAEKVHQLITAEMQSRDELAFKAHGSRVK